jgi:hypothetical protein
VKPGDHVRTKVPLRGTARGPSAAHRDGCPREIPTGGSCDLFDVARITGWLTLHYDLDESGPREPYRCEAIAFSDQAEPAARPPLPSIIPEGTPNTE